MTIRNKTRYEYHADIKQEMITQELKTAEIMIEKLNEYIDKESV
jgi:hypothetical protein